MTATGQWATPLPFPPRDFFLSIFFRRWRNAFFNTRCALKDLPRTLEEFAGKHDMLGKGGLCVGLVITRHAINKGLPLNADDLLAESGGQVVGLGKSQVQSILKDHKITRVLAEEGGRTSRGSVGRMRDYVSFLNALGGKGNADLAAIEKWWVSKVRQHFASKPFLLRFDPSKSLRSIVSDLLGQAQKRQQESSGATFVGTVLQHLVGAKLDLLLQGKIEHHGASVADQASGRPADFIVEDVAIHVTTTPTEAVIRKCRKNLDAGLRPLLITIHKGRDVAEGLADQAGISDRLDVFEADQFIAGNLYEFAKFKAKERRLSANELVNHYNQIIAQYEADPSLRIEISK
jgi:hypothetical protein